MLMSFWINRIQKQWKGKKDNNKRELKYQETRWNVEVEKEEAKRLKINLKYKTQNKKNQNKTEKKKFF